MHTSPFTPCPAHSLLLQNSKPSWECAAWFMFRLYIPERFEDCGVGPCGHFVSTPWHDASWEWWECAHKARRCLPQADPFLYFILHVSALPQVTKVTPWLLCFTEEVTVLYSLIIICLINTYYLLWVLRRQRWVEKRCRGGEMARQLRTLASLAEDRVPFLDSMQRFLTVCSSSAGASDTLLDH